MSVPKAKKKKHNKNKMTKYDLELAQKKLDAKVEGLKDEASAVGTRVFGCLCFLALHKGFGFGQKELNKVQEEIDKICERIQDETDYNWNNVYEELYPLGFVVDGVEFDENGKVKQ